jgi:hypothetical protein
MILLLIPVVIVLLAGAWLLTALMLMVTIGIAHLDWWPLIPLISYRHALPLALMLTLLGFIGGGTAYSGNRKR